MPVKYPHLFSPVTVGNVTVKNRILSTGHDTSLPRDHHVNAPLIAYHEARAKGGCGLIVAQVASVHETGLYSSHVLKATTDECIPGYRKLAEMCHSHDCRLFGQLFHPGREIMEGQDGSIVVAYAPSAVPNERFHVMPRPLPQKADRRDRRRLWRGGAADAQRRHGWLRDRGQPRLSAVAIPQSPPQPARATSMAGPSRTGCASCAR